MIRNPIRSPLGRETSIQSWSWGEDGWLRLSHGSQQAQIDVPSPVTREPNAGNAFGVSSSTVSSQTDLIHGPASSVTESADVRYDFDTQALPIDFQWLRTPELDASVLSDEGGRGEHASSTDCLVGMVAFDVSGGAQAADFNYFEYKGS